MFKSILIVFISIFALGYSTVKCPDLQKCELKDNECMGKVYENMVKKIARKGLSEYGIHPLDPMPLKDMTIPILDLAKFTMKSGVAKGISSCVFNKFSINLDKGSGHQDNTCPRIIVEGNYLLTSSSPALSQVFGRNGNVSGDGTMKVSIKNIHLTYDFPVYPEKRPDGEIYMTSDYKKIVYNYDILGGVHFSANNILVGDQEISKDVIPFMNENWEFVTTSFGKPFLDKAMEINFGLAANFFKAVPARCFIVDDLTSYVKP